MNQTKDVTLWEGQQWTHVNKNLLVFLINGKINNLHHTLQAKQLSEVAGTSKVFTT